MKSHRIILAIVALIAVLVSMEGAAQDRFALKAANGVAFAEFKGYEDWQTVAVSQTPDGIKTILANPVMMRAYRQGAHTTANPFPQGSMIVKIEWSRKKSTVSPYPVEVPDTLKSVSFIEKDSKRFGDTDGWGYAQFLYDAKAGTFSPSTKDPSFGKTLCHQCHIRVKAEDFIFTAYAPR